MAKTLRCDAIFLGCGHVIHAESEEELMRLAAEHAREVHGITDIDPAMVSKVKAAIKDE
jgi:predicted small metal-binding protein